MLEFEINIINKLQSSLTPFFEKLFEIVTYFGGQEVLIVVILFIYFVYSKKAGQRIAFTVFGSLLLNNSLKGVINRTRPFDNPKAEYQLDSAITDHATGQSFPSGHSQNSAVSYTSIGILFKKKEIWVIVALLIAIIGLSRVVLGVHYPTDVIAGITLGISFAVVGMHIHQKVEEDFQKQMMLYGIVAIIFLPFIFIFWRKEFTDIEKYKDFYTGYAFYIGYVISVWLERKYVNFNCKNFLIIRVIRSILALVIVVVILFGLKAILNDENILMDMLRYFMLSFVGLGVYPIITKKWLFS